MNTNGFGRAIRAGVVLGVTAVLWAGAASTQERQRREPPDRGAQSQPDRQEPAGEREPPQQAYDDCKGKTAGDTVQHATPEGTVPATCVDSPRGLVARPDRGQGDRQGGRENGGQRGQRGQDGQDGQGDRGGQDRSPRDAKGGGYSVDQAVSDRAQLNTIAFDGLAFLTGESACNTFLPPGKAADFFGFQYMRDVDRNQLGHNTSFVPRAANAVLALLDGGQRAALVALAQEQERLLTEFALKRFPLVVAFGRQLAGDVPAGSAGLDRAAVMRYAAGLFEIDGALSYRRAEVLGGIVRSLTPAQRERLARMSFDDSSTWPETADQLDKRSLSHTAHVAVMTYASELFSWYAGSVEADTYFCPERHATYFGSFYMKDIPAMGNAGYSISTSLTGDSGEAFLAALSAPQRALVTGLVEQQRADLAEIVRTRRAIAAELRRFQQSPAADRAKVMSLAKRYGELDGEISYLYTRAFTEVARTLTPDQKRRLLQLRNLDERYACSGAYLFSRQIAMPQVSNTDYFFLGSGPAPTVTGAAVPAAAPATALTAPAAPAAAAVAASDSATGFALHSPAVAAGGWLPQEYTGDGAGKTLPLAWSGAPAGTRSFAVVMHHVDPEGKTKWYWILYDIPAEVRSLPAGGGGAGTLGTNSVNGRTEYAPPHSKGPGEKTYVYTVYALSAPVQPGVQPAQVTRDLLLAAMKGRILASAQLSVVYARDVQAQSARGAAGR